MSERVSTPPTITKRYFVNREGVPTTRMANVAGQSHFEAATSVERLDPAVDFYQQMFDLKYIRVAEDSASKTVYIDAPVPTIQHLTVGQRRWLDEKCREGWTIDHNSRDFLEGRDASRRLDKPGPAALKSPDRRTTADLPNEVLVEQRR
jgi:hypothetical protein